MRLAISKLKPMTSTSSGGGHLRLNRRALLDAAVAAVAAMEVVEAASERGAGNVIMSGVALNAISTVVTLLGEAEAALTTILVVDSDIVTMRMSLSVGHSHAIGGPRRRRDASRRGNSPVNVNTTDAKTGATALCKRSIRRPVLAR